MRGRSGIFRGTKVTLINSRLRIDQVQALRCKAVRRPEPRNLKSVAPRIVPAFHAR